MVNRFKLPRSRRKPVVKKFKLATVVLLLKLFHALRRPAYKRILNRRFYLCPNVFDPLRTLTGKLLIKNTALIEGDIVLDLGTGSGVIAVFLAEKAGKVIATDISPAAVQCAKINADLNDRKEKIEVRQGNLFEPVKGEKFDLIVFNPPYLPGKARNLLEQAWFDENQELICKFFKQAGEFINPGGRIEIAYSNFGNIFQLEEIIGHFGFKFEVTAEMRTPFEKIYLYQIIA